MLRSITPKRARRPFDASVDHTEARKATVRRFGRSLPGEDVGWQVGEHLVLLISVRLANRAASRIDWLIGRKRCALRSVRPKRQTVALRASV